MSNPSSNEKCRWTRLPDVDHPFELSPHRYWVECNEKVARGGRSIYPDVCPGCKRPVTIWSLAPETRELQQLRDEQQWNWTQFNRIAVAVGMLGDRTDAVIDAVLARLAPTTTDGCPPGMRPETDDERRHRENYEGPGHGPRFYPKTTERQP